MANATYSTVLAVLGPPLLVQWNVPRLITAPVVGLICAANPLQFVAAPVPARTARANRPVASPPGMMSVPMSLSRVVHRRELQSRMSPTNQPTAPIHRWLGGWLLRLDDVTRRPQTLEHFQRLVVRRAEGDRLRQVALDLRDQLTQALRRQMTSGLPQASQIIVSQRMPRPIGHAVAPNPSSVSTDSRNRAQCSAKAWSAASPSLVIR
jgi:hypothetical protein